MELNWWFGIGLVIGSFVLVIGFFMVAPKFMFLENVVPHSMEEAEEILKKNIELLHWKIPFVHDMQNTMKNNGHEVLPLKIIEICKPDIAVEVLGKSDERIVSSLMPCRISLYMKGDGRVYVSRLNAGLFSQPLGKIIRGAMSRASNETEEIIKSITN